MHGRQNIKICDRGSFRFVCAGADSFSIHHGAFWGYVCR